MVCQNRLEMLLDLPNIYDINHHRLSRWAFLLTIQMLVPFELSKTCCVFFKKKAFYAEINARVLLKRQTAEITLLAVPPLKPLEIRKFRPISFLRFSSVSLASSPLPRPPPTNLTHSWCTLASKPSKPKTLACRRRCRRGSLRSRPRPTLASQQP